MDVFLQKSSALGGKVELILRETSNFCPCPCLGGESGDNGTNPKQEPPQGTLRPGGYLPKTKELPYVF
jgi:hypothetical protein